MILFWGISNVTVDLQSWVLYFAQRNVIDFHAANCVNLTLRNFTVDYLQLPFTQLTVTAVNPTARTLSVKQIGNYRSPLSFNSVTIPPGINDAGYFSFAFAFAFAFAFSFPLPFPSAFPDVTQLPTT